MSTAATSWNENRAIAVLVAFTLALGILLRFWSLGAQPLAPTELDYHFSALDYSGNTAAAQPSGEVAGRGPLMVAVIATSQKIFRNQEIADRIPSAIIGSIALLLFSGLVWMLAGPWAALGATFLFSFYPEGIRQSRTAGLYSFQQFCGIIALGAGWLATNRAVPAQTSPGADLIRRWAWAGMAGLFFLMAALSHLSAATVAAAFGAWVLCLAALSLWLGGVRSIRTNLALQLVAAGVLGAAALLIVRPDAIAAVLDKVSAAPPATIDISGGDPRSPTFYLRTYASQYGWLLTLLPLLALLVVRPFRWLAAYLVLWFTIPFLAHSLLIARKEERLLLIAAPALFMLGGLAISAGREILSRAIIEHTREWITTYRSVLRLASGLTALVAASALLTLPAFQQSFEVALGRDGATSADWRELRTVLSKEPQGQTTPLGATEPLAAIRYLDRADFAVGMALTSAQQAVVPNTENIRAALSEDSVLVEKRSGAVLATDLGTLIRAYSYYESVLIALDSRELNSAVLDSSISNALTTNATELCAGRCGQLRLYRLPVAARD